MPIIYVMEPRHSALVPPSPEFGASDPFPVPDYGKVMTDEEQLAFKTHFNEAIGRIENSNETAGRIEQNSVSSNPLIQATYGVSLPGYVKEQERYEQYLHDLTDLDAASAAKELKDIIISGDTARSLDWLSETIDGVVNITEELETQASEAHDHLLDAQAESRRSRNHLIQSRRHNNTRPIDVTVPGADATESEIDDHKHRMDTKKHHDARDKTNATVAARHHVDSEKRRRELKRADSKAFLHEGLDEKLGAIFDELSPKYEDTYEYLDNLDHEVNELMRGWDLGATIPSPELEGDIARLFSEWARELSALSVYDSERTRSLGLWVQQAVRFHQRRALSMDPATANRPEFTPDRGITIDSILGHVTLYEDGSMSRNENGELVRRFPNGKPWEEESSRKFPEEPSYFQRLDSVPDDQLYTRFTRALDNWEQHRTPDTEVNAAFATRAYTGRLEGHVAEHQEYYREQRLASLGAYITLRTATESRDININILTARLEYPNDPSEVVRNTREVDAEIAAFQRAYDAVVAERDSALNDLLATRTGVNIANYWRSFLMVTQLEAARLHNKEKAQISPDGSVILHNTTLNGIKGAWVISRDGSADLQNTDGSIDHYGADGELE